MKDLRIETCFIYHEIEKDIAENRFSRPIMTRFPPEPNGFLHIGSAYAINISYSVYETFGGGFNLRFDDTNPAKEKMSYCEAIERDMDWMGFDYGHEALFGSDYFDQTFEAAEALIEKGLAYVCELSGEEMRRQRGTLTRVGENSPYRERIIDENLRLFHEMKEGKHPDGSMTLRAKIDMSSPNINLRDPVLYRIKRHRHYRLGSKWCIYPMYDFAHPIQDAIEGITHSLCSAEFKDHRPFYEWVLKALEVKEPPRQIEFGRMGIRGTVMSKRHLVTLVEEGHVSGWDDPRLPTLAAMRRRGFSPLAIRQFLGALGVSKHESMADISMLEHFVRNDLAGRVPAYMLIKDPLHLEIDNWPDEDIEILTLANHPKDESMGERGIHFSKHLWIDRDDFLEEAPRGFKRLTLEGEVRLRGAFFIKVKEVIKDSDGQVTKLVCTYDPETKSGSGFNQRKPKGTIHWVSHTDCADALVRVYDRLVLDKATGDDQTSFMDRINPNALVTYPHAKVENIISRLNIKEAFQGIREGYFNIDIEADAEHLVINRIVALKGT